MRIIPFRIKAHEDDDNYSDVYEFLIEGSKKDAYEIEIDIDSLNDLGITDTRCTCPDHTFRGSYCKHISECDKILGCFDIKTESPVKPKVVILDENELSMSKYAEEYPENFKAITESETTNIKSANNTDCPCTDMPEEAVKGLLSAFEDVKNGDYIELVDDTSNVQEASHD